MRKATFTELKSGSERFVAICVSRSNSLPELFLLTYNGKENENSVTVIIIIPNAICF